MAKKRGKARKRGALGALQTDLAAGATHRASDLNMIGRAVREEWPIPEAKRPAVISRLLKNVEKGDVDQSNKAAMVLTNMSRVNQADRHHTEKIKADANKPKEAVRILVLDGRGSERAVNLREFYDTTVIDAAPPALQLPAADAAGSGSEQGG